jgi:uncharacterized protein (DUF2235 family)
LKTARALLPEDSRGTAQVIHYESGVGTDLDMRLFGGAFGSGLFDNVRSCYRFLVHNFNPGDTLYFFGFSRGAYTARSLAGLVRNSGILKRGHEGREQDAVGLYRDYSDATAPDGPDSIAFRAAHSHETDIHFIGVWDTVGALGVPGLSGRFRLARGLDWQFHDVELSKRVRYACHALAIHEHRAEFVPTLWEKKDGAPESQVLEQRWFSGAHSDVGGGYFQSGLSDVALEWMVNQATSAGLEFNLDALKIGAPPYDPNPLAEGHNSFSALYKIIDMLRGKQDGEMRQYDQTLRSTYQVIDRSVQQRFPHYPDARHWPDSFYEALRGESEQTI